MTPEEITDEESLEAWLEGKPTEWSVWIAHRAAARVLPLWWEFAEGSQDPDLTALPILRSSLISGERAKYTSPEIRDAAAAAAYADAADAAAAAAYADAAAWKVARADVQHLLENGVSAQPLFPKEEAAEAEATWQAIRQKIPRPNPAQGPETARETTEIADYHSFWIPWYEDLRAGRAPANPDLLRDIALIDPDDWDKGDVFINNVKIPELVTKHSLPGLIKNTPHGEEVVLAEDGDALSLKRTDQIEQTYLDNVLGFVSSARRIFDDLDGENKEYAILRGELRILDDAIGLHRNEPVQILSDVSRVLGRLEAKIERQDCAKPSADDDIKDFGDLLLRAQVDLIGLSPEVKSYFEARKPVANQEDAAEVARAADVARQAGDKMLANELETARQLLLDPEGDEVEKRLAFYRLASLLSRMYSMARFGLNEAQEVSTDVAKLGRNVLFLASSPEIYRALQVLIQTFVG